MKTQLQSVSREQELALAPLPNEVPLPIPPQQLEAVRRTMTLLRGTDLKES